MTPVRPGGDYSFSRPAPAALRDAGWTFVARYVADTPGVPGKRLTLAEARALSSAGLDLVAVYQTTKGLLKGGAAAGTTHARAAQANATAAGMPADRPIYFAADWDVQPAQMIAVLMFLDAARDVLGPGRVGLYGGYPVVARAQGHWAVHHPGERLFTWQTKSWSAGKWAAVDLRQHTHDITLAGAQVDLDSAHTSDFGQWKASMADLWMPGAEHRDVGDHAPTDGGPAKAIAHITWDVNATASAPRDLVPYENLRGYFTGGGKSVAPHILWDPFTGRFSQFAPASSRTKSVQDDAGETRTNRAGSVVLQIEALFFPYCRTGGKVYTWLSDTPCKGWDRLHAWVKSWGVPDVWPMGRPVDFTPHRSEGTWETHGGWYAHAHVPENDHVDPGSWPAFLPTADTSPAPPLEDEIMAMTPKERADFIHDIAEAVVTYRFADPAAKPGPDGKAVMKEMLEFIRYADFLHLGDRKVTETESAKILAKVAVLQAKVDAIALGGGQIDVTALVEAFIAQLAKRLES